MGIVNGVSWAGLLLVSFIGWGCLVERWLFGSLRAAWSLQSIWGMSLLAFLGGILNLGGVCSSYLARTLVLAGVALFYFIKYRKSGKPAWMSYSHVRANPGLSILFMCLLIWSSGEVVSWTWDTNPNFSDDLQGYFILPQRILDHGSMGPDPFNMRIHLTSLGATPFLQSLLQSQTTFRYLNLLDAGAGLVILLGLIWSYGTEHNANRTWCLIVMLFAAVIPLPHANVTALRLGVCLLLGLSQTLSYVHSESVPTIRRCGLIALTLSCACGLKTTFLPIGCATVFAFYAFRLSVTQWKNILAEGVGIGLITLALLLPWMLAMHQSGGTFLFPSLGMGNHKAEYVLWPSERRIAPALVAAVCDVQIGAMLFLGMMWLFCRPWQSHKDLPTLSLLAGSVAGVLAVTYVSYGLGQDFVQRYTFSAAFCCCLVLFIQLDPSHFGVSFSGRGLRTLLTAGILVGLTLSSVLQPWPTFGFWNRLADEYSAYSAAQGDPDSIDVQRSQYLKQVQTSLRRDSTLLARLSLPNLLDYSSNRIFVVDHPGAFSPPPGMPLGKGGEALAQYLQNHDVDYVIYSYADQANFSPSVTTQRIEHATHEVMKYVAEVTVKFNSDLDAMPSVRKTIYRDPYCWIVDLKQSASQ